MLTNVRKMVALFAMVMALALPLGSVNAAVRMPSLDGNVQQRTVDQQAPATQEEQVFMEEENIAPTQDARYSVLVAKLGDGNVIEGMYNAEGVSVKDLFEKTSPAHRTKYVLLSTNQEEVARIANETKTLKSEFVEVVEAGKIPVEVEQTMVTELGSEDYFAAIITYKQPGHKSWLQKTGEGLLGSLLGGIF